MEPTIDSLSLVSSIIDQHYDSIRKLKNTDYNQIVKVCKLIADCLLKDGTVFWCGNGGSAADSQHLAAELVGRFKNDRKPLKSIALTSDTSVLTCISNDYNYDSIFSRQLEALASEGDILIAISTSGNSSNIVNALRAAGKLGVKTIGLFGENGGKALDFADFTILAPSTNTARIQEIHILIGHIMCEVLEKELGLV